MPHTEEITNESAASNVTKERKKKGRRGGRNNSHNYQP
jgi:hypothetical protein